MRQRVFKILRYFGSMTTTIEHLHQDILSIKKDLAFIKHAVRENFELSVEAKRELKEAMAVPDSELVDLKDLE